MVSIQTKTKQDNGIVAKKPSNYQQHQKATGNGQRKKKSEEPKYSDSEQQGKDDKTYNFRRASTKERERRQYKFRTGLGGKLRIVVV